MRENRFPDPPGSNEGAWNLKVTGSAMGLHDCRKPWSLPLNIRPFPAKSPIIQCSKVNQQQALCQPLSSLKNMFEKKQCSSTFHSRVSGSWGPSGRERKASLSRWPLRWLLANGARWDAFTTAGRKWWLWLYTLDLMKITTVWWFQPIQRILHSFWIIIPKMYFVETTSQVKCNQLVNLDPLWVAKLIKLKNTDKRGTLFFNCFVWYLNSFVMLLAHQPSTGAKSLPTKSTQPLSGKQSNILHPVN